MLKKLVFGAAVLALIAPAGLASAHDDGYDYGYGYGPFGYYWQHAQDHREHAEFHDEGAEAHALAHAEGFASPEDHAAWHEAAREAHWAFHEDHPDTWHDHYDWRGYYGPAYGYAYGGYTPYYPSYGPYGPYGFPYAFAFNFGGY